MISSQYTAVKITDSDDLLIALRKIHEKVPLVRNITNDLLSLPDDMIRYIIAGIRNIPEIPPNSSFKDWNTCVSLLRLHRILPLLAYHMYAWPLECQPPGEIVAELIQEYNMAAVKTMLVERQLESLIEAFKHAELPFLLLKGQGLARTVYPDPALRQSSDIDLMVLPENMKKMERVLEGIGYFSPDKSFDISPLFYPEQLFLPPKQGLTVEGHWSIDYNFDMFLDDWLLHAFRDRISVKNSGIQFDTLKNTHNLVYLAFHHVFQHDTITLSWIMDIAYLMKGLSEEDWLKISCDSVDNNIRISMEYALLAASLWSGFLIPKKYNNFSSWPNPSIKELKIQRYAKIQGTNLIYFVHLLRALPNRKEKIRFIYRFIFPPPRLLFIFLRSDSMFALVSAHVRRWMSFTRHLK